MEGKVESRKAKVENLREPKLRSVGALAIFGKKLSVRDD